MPAKSTLELVFVFQGNATNISIDALCLCHISDAEMPIGIIVKSKVDGLSVSYKVTDSVQENDDSLFTDLKSQTELNPIDFGPDVPIFDSRTMYLLLKNTSLIPTTFNLSLGQYGFPMEDLAARPSSPAKAPGAGGPMPPITGASAATARSKQSGLSSLSIKSRPLLSEKGKGYFTQTPIKGYWKFKS